MFAYYVELAVRSLRRSPGLTVLMVLAISLGVSASMTMYSVFRGMSSDPIPWKSSKLFVPQIDAWGPKGRSHGEPVDGLTYIDALALTRQHRAVRQSAIYPVVPSAMPTDASLNRSPLLLHGYAVYNEFFPMLDVPFHYGSGWSADDDKHLTPVAVIGDRLNQQVFGGGNSVGKTINIDNHDYRIVGVIDDWNPNPRFFDLKDGSFYKDGPDVFLPFQQAVAVNMHSDGDVECPKSASSQPDFNGLQQSSCVWVAYMAELDDAAAVRQYMDYLTAYANEQRENGRFDWAADNRLRDVPTLLDYEQVVPKDTGVSLLVALGLLIVFLVNTVALLLTKFLRRSGEIGVRRALGASRQAIYAQFLIEAGVIGASGGVLGLLFTAVGVVVIETVLPPSLAHLASVDPSLLLLTLLTAVIATLFAGLYPTLRASRVQPAWQLKVN